MERTHPYPATPSRQPRQPEELPKPGPGKDTPVEPIVAAKTLAEQGRGNIFSDVLGSYTGSGTTDPQPEQDADDL